MGHASDEATPQILSEIPGGFQIGRYRISPDKPEIGSTAWFSEAAGRHIAALSRPYTKDLDPEIEALLVESEPEDDSPEPPPAPFSPPAPKRPLTPLAAKIAEEAAKIAEEKARIAAGAADETTVNMGAAVDEIMLGLRDDLSFTVKSVPRPPSPDIELVEIEEPDEAVEMILNRSSLFMMWWMQSIHPAFS